MSRLHAFPEVVFAFNTLAYIECATYNEVFILVI